MAKVLFDTLGELLADVAAGDDRSAFLVKYRAKDYFALAIDEDGALAAVARSLSMEVGAVPLDLILAAVRGGGAAPEKREETAPKWQLEALSASDVRQIATSFGIDIRGMQKATLIEKIREVDASYRQPAE